MEPCQRLALIALLTSCAPGAWAQDAARLQTRALAANCAQCHGTEGRTVNGSAVPALAGMPREYFVTQMTAFKSGTRSATVMHQLAKGFSDQQIASLAAYFAASKP